MKIKLLKKFRKRAESRYKVIRVLGMYRVIGFYDGSTPTNLNNYDTLDQAIRSCNWYRRNYVSNLLMEAQENKRKILY